MAFPRHALALSALAAMLLMAGALQTRASAQAPKPAPKPARTVPGPGPTPPRLSGIWTRTKSQEPRELPLNKRGIALREAIDEPLSPMYDCVPATVPHILGDPYNFSFQQMNDRVIQKFEKDGVTRTLWLEGHHREAVNNDFGVQGYSMAHYEGDTLVVVTTKYVFDMGGLEDKPPMVPSSTQKKITERYTRKGDQLIVDLTLEDKLMMTAPALFHFEFKPTKEELVDWPECDPEQARAPINYMPINQLKYGIR